VEHVLIGVYLKRWALPDRQGIQGDPGLEISLCLFANGRFAYVGYWRLYELTTAFGSWRQDGLIIHLAGYGEIHSSDSEPFQRGSRPFHRTFTYYVEKDTPYLLALDEPTKWSLLSWRGPYEFRGERLEMNLGPTGLPTTWDALGRLATRLAESG
jgi:hypothetical protein